MPYFYACSDTLTLLAVNASPYDGVSYEQLNNSLNFNIYSAYKKQQQHFNEFRMFVFVQYYSLAAAATAVSIGAKIERNLFVCECAFENEVKPNLNYNLK